MSVRWILPLALGVMVLAAVAGILRIKHNQPKKYLAWRRKALSRSSVNVTISVMVVLAVACVGLVVEDLIPKPGEGIDINFWRPVAALVLMVALSLLVRYRSRLAQIQGTLYYVRLLEGWMGDWHLEREREHAEHFFDERVVARQVSARPVGGVIDIANDVSEMTAALEQTINDDSVETGFTVAPNMLWPPALAAGYRFYVPRGLELLELDRGRSMRWLFGPSEARVGRRRHSTYWDRLTRRLPGPPLTAHYDEPCIRIDKGRDGPVRSVLVTVDLTGKPAGGAGRGGTVGSSERPPVAPEQCTPPRGLTPDARVRVAVFETNAGALDEQNRDVIVRTAPRTEDAECGQGPAIVHPKTAARRLAEGIHTAVREFQEATVYVVVRAPKSVVFAAGHLLSGPGGLHGGNHHPPVHERRPWQRLVLLQRDQDQPRERQDLYHAMRVHPAQPPAEEMAERARAHGLLLSGAAPKREGVRILNLTAHDIRLYEGDEVVMTWPRSGVVARIRESATPLPAIDTTDGPVPRVRAAYEDQVEGLPDPDPGVGYIVSRVLAAAISRADLFFPWGEVRDGDGQIVGCRALGQFLPEQAPGA